MDVLYPEGESYFDPCLGLAPLLKIAQDGSLLCCKSSLPAIFNQQKTGIDQKTKHG